MNNKYKQQYNKKVVEYVLMWLDNKMTTGELQKKLKIKTGGNVYSTIAHTIRIKKLKKYE